MKNPSESLTTNKQEAEKSFEMFFRMIMSASGKFVEYSLPYPLVEFLKYLTRRKNLLIHGSNRNVEELQPRQANCKSKKFGNLNAVYATEDAVLPIFYAIKDKDKFRGMAVSDFSETKQQDGTPEKTYNFEVEQNMLKSVPWSEGVIYILSKDSFEQGTDDSGRPIDEWISKSSVRPLARLRVAPKDFPYLGNLKPLG